MSACIFVGPTVPPEIARGVLEALYLPPARQGDVFRAAVRYRPRALGIVDGYFREVPSIWHKEILWAMAEGIHVFGSASMGALRGAELAAFGMRGVGRIFEAYRDGRLDPYESEPFEDDDEVTVVHGSPETGYPTLSEAMVNIRCTLAAAAEAGVIAPATRDALAMLAKDLFYPARSYERLLARATEAALPARELDALRAWLPDGHVNQKRVDALAMLAAMRDFLAADPGPLRVDYVFERSDMWEQATLAWCSAGSGRQEAVPTVPGDAVHEELGLDGVAHVDARRAATLRLAALRECERLRLTPSDAERRRAADALRSRLGLFGPGMLERWLSDNDLTPPAFARLVGDEACLGQLERLAGSGVDAYLLDHLRTSGQYARYAVRAREKRRVVAESGLDDLLVDDRTAFRLTFWYFERHLGIPIPDDIPGYAARLGFADAEAFYRALRREYAYLLPREAPDRTDGACPDATPER